MKQRKDGAYTSGVIAAKEKKLLKEKLAKMCSVSEEEAVRLLSDSGFGGGASQDLEELILADEGEIDAFIREYAPSEEVEEYLLAPRDFHNAKAIVKARHLNCDPAPMLGSDGKFSAAEIGRFIETGETEKLGKELNEAIQDAETLLQGENPSGAEVGFLFDRAQFRYLARILKKFGACRKLLIRRADMTNLLTYFRAENSDDAAKFFVDGGSLTKDKLACVFEGTETALKSFNKSDYQEFVKMLCAAKDKADPYTEAEKALESFETDFFSEKPYELSGQGNFLYYVFRRRIENENVRIVFVCLRAGLNEAEIKKRLRGKV